MTACEKNAKTKEMGSTIVIIKKLITLALMFGFGYLPVFGQMTPLGMKVLGVFLGTIFGWITLDLLWPSLVGIVALGLTGIYSSLGDCFAACFGTQTSLLILGSIFVCALVSYTDLSSVIVSFFVNLPIAKKSPFIMTFLIFIAAWIVSTLSHCIVAAVLMLALYRTMAENSHVPAQSKTNSYMLVGITLSCMFGDLTFPFRPIAYSILNVYIAYAGANIPFAQYMLTCTPGLFLMLVCYVLLGKLSKVDLSYFQNAAVSMQDVKASKKHIMALIFVVLMLVSLMIPSVAADSTFPLFQLMNQLGLGGLTVVWMILMMTWQVDGKPLMDISALSGQFQWGVYLCVCFLIPLANAISADSVGITETLKTFFSPILSGMPPIAFLIAVILLSIVFTNVLNNMVVAMIFIALIFSLQDYLVGINLTAAVLSIMLASYVACATPAASPLNAFMYGQKDLVSFSNQMLQGLKTCLLLAAFILIIFYPFASFVL